MSESPAAPSPRPRRELQTRIFWFLAGSGVNYLLISTPFKYLQRHTGMSIWQLSACSLAISTTFFFLWNYYINFRTETRKRAALPRYLGAVVCMWALSSTLLTVLKHHNAHYALLGLDLDIIGTQLMLGGLKFLLYHLWVFPPAARPAGPAQTLPSAETLSPERAPAPADP